MRSSTRRFVGLLYFCFSYVCYSGGLFIPSTDQSVSGLLRRVDDPDFVTMYNIFDQAPPDVAPIGNDSPRLRPIAEVLITMNIITSTPSSTFAPTPASVTIDQAQPAASPLLEFISSSTDAVFTPVPHSDAGPEVLTSPAYSEGISPTPRTNNTSLDDKAVASGTPKPAKQLVVLGTIVGGIVFFAVCVLLLLSPICSGSRLGCGKLDKPVKKPEKEKDVQEKKDATSWVSTTVSSETVKDTISKNDAIIDIMPAVESSMDNESDTPTSKFSMCSSEYPPSSLSSTISSDLASNASTVKANPSSQQPTDCGSSMAPIRPPRPTTVDSPALSESVYLACSDSDQPYVIVTPQPLTDEDLQTSIIASKSSRKLLTPSEFAAMHIRLAISRLTSTNKRTSSESRHSRTKSAPTIGRRYFRNSVANEGAFPFSKDILSSSRKSCGDALKKPVFKITKSRSEEDESEELLEDIENDSDVQESMVRRVMKHRRSRSASGWAYPSKGRMTRRPFKSEEE